MAAITTFATLKTEVAAWLHRSDLTTDIAGLVQFGENRVYRDLRLKAMETSLSSAISSGVVALPTGYLELKYAYVDGSPMSKLQRKDAEWIYQNYPTRSSDGKPKFIAREADNFIFGPYPDSTYTIKGVYYKRLTALSADADTNWFIANAPELLLFATLCEAAPYIGNDPRIAVWEDKYAQIKRRIQVNDEQEEFSGSPLQVTVR